MDALVFPSQGRRRDGREAVPVQLADMAVAALIDEATLTPKPGLVDLRSRGAHRDMDWLLLCHSAWALHPAFCALAEAGRQIAEPLALRERIGQIGRDGEAAMMRATGGINTHRGAIWALGLLVTAAAQEPALQAPQAVAVRAGVIARYRDRLAPASTGNKGEIACRRHGVGGARAEAQAGFPHAIHVALPCLERSRANGGDERSARLNALVALMAQLDDTCVLSRGGSAALAAVQAGAAQVLAAGGAGCREGRRALRKLERSLIAANLSPGGAADLLAATLFLDRLADNRGQTTFHRKLNGMGIPN
jgi:triphosphoribosyl-dephospho-CoA synthase